LELVEITAFWSFDKKIKAAGFISMSVEIVQPRWLEPKG